MSKYAALTIAKGADSKATASVAKIAKTAKWNNNPYIFDDSTLKNKNCVFFNKSAPFQCLKGHNRGAYLKAGGFCPPAYYVKC